MSVIESQVDPTSEAFRENAAHMDGLVAELRERLQAARAGGGEEAVKRHREQGKLLARERIERLLDPGTPFLELGALAAHGLYDGAAPAAGIVTGIGRVRGREVMVVANDATVKGGTYFPLTVKKHLRAQEIALENRLPCVYLVDSGGAFLPLQAEVFPDRDHFGRIFYNQARMCAAGIPQISVVLGSCTAGGAYVPAMSDEAVIVKGRGTIFLGGPPLVKAATGEEVTAEELGGADVHTPRSPASPTTTRRTTSTRSRSRARHRRPPDRAQASRRGTSQRARGAALRPAGDLRHRAREPAQGLRRARGDRAPRRRQPLPRVQGALRHDARHRLRAPHGLSRSGSSPTTACCSPRARSRPRTSSSCAASARIPLVFLQNITGFIVGKEYEQKGIAKDGAKMVHAVANAQVPKFTVIIGGSFGAGNYGMCGRAYQPRQLWMWPNARISRDGRRAGGRRCWRRSSRSSSSAQGKPMTRRGGGGVQGARSSPSTRRRAAPTTRPRACGTTASSLPPTRAPCSALGISAALNAPIPEPRFGVFRM